MINFEFVLLIQRKCVQLDMISIRDILGEMRHLTEFVNETKFRLKDKPQKLFQVQKCFINQYGSKQ